MKQPTSAIDLINATRGHSPPELQEKFTPEQMASALYLLHHWHKGDMESRDKRSSRHYRMLQVYAGKYAILKLENNALRKKLYPNQYD